MVDGVEYNVEYNMEYGLFTTNTLTIVSLY